MHPRSILPHAIPHMGAAPAAAAERHPLRPLLSQALALALLLAAGLGAVALLPRQAVAGVAGYAALHTIMEIFALLVALLIFAVGWADAGRQPPASTVILAGGFLAVGLLDLLHLLSYAGMPPLVTPADPEKAIFFWLAARLLTALALLQLVLRPCGRPASLALRAATLGASLGVVALAAWVGLWHADLLPRTFIAGVGLTPLKVAVEYVITGLFLAAAALLLARRRLVAPFGVPSLLFALLTLAAGEICFTLYVEVSDGFNLLGHGYKLLAGLFLYRALFAGAIRAPYQELAAARDLLAREHEALVAGEARFRAAMDGSLDAFMTLRCVRDERGRVVDLVTTDLNQRAAARMGQPRQWLIGRSLSQAPAYVAAAHRLDTLAAVVETGETHESVVAVALPSGQTVWTQQQIVPLADGVAVSFRDVTERHLMEQTLRDREETYRGFVEQSAEGLLLTNEAGVIIEFNAALAEQTGLPRAAALGLSLVDLQLRLALPEMCTPENVARMRAGFAAALATGEGPLLGRPVEMRFLRPDGSTRVVQQTLFAIRTAHGVRLGGISRDITVRHAMEQALRESEERLSLVLEGSDDGFWDWNVATGDVLFSERWAGMLGYRLDEITPHVSTWERLVHPEDMPLVMERLNAHLERRSPRYEVEHRLLAKTGEWRWILDRGRVTSRDAQGRPLRMAGTHTDITERKLLEAALHQRQDELRAANGQLQQLAATDGLTGLRNHRAFQDALAGLTHDQAAQQPALILLDIDHFKQFNDTYGHPEGDAVLCTVAGLLRGAVRAGDMVARYGGEEFAVLLPSCSAAAAAEIAERCREALARHPWPLRPITASFGVAALAPHVVTAAQLIAAADGALYAAKRAGRNGTCVAAGPVERPGAFQAIGRLARAPAGSADESGQAVR